MRTTSRIFVIVLGTLSFLLALTVSYDWTPVPSLVAVETVQSAVQLEPTIAPSPTSSPTPSTAIPLKHLMSHTSQSKPSACQSVAESYYYVEEKARLTCEIQELLSLAIVSDNPDQYQSEWLELQQELLLQFESDQFVATDIVTTVAVFQAAYDEIAATDWVIKKVGWENVYIPERATYLDSITWLGGDSGFARAYMFDSREPNSLMFSVDVEDTHIQFVCSRELLGFLNPKGYDQYELGILFREAQWVILRNCAIIAFDNEDSLSVGGFLQLEELPPDFPDAPQEAGFQA